MQIFLFLKNLHLEKCSHLIFLYIIGHNNISWRPHDPLSQNLGSQPPGLTRMCLSGFINFRLETINFRLPVDIKSTCDTGSFKKQLKTFLFRPAFCENIEYAYPDL